MMIVTGAAEFPGSCMISKLNQHNFNYIMAVDDFENPETERNLYQKKIQARIHTGQLVDWLAQNYHEVEFIFHFDSITKSNDDQGFTEKSSSSDLSKEIWQLCIDYQIPLIFCLSKTPEHTQSLSSGKSFEQWVLQQKKKPFFWAGLKLPEVYGPNEYYLDESASIIYRWFKQWQQDKSNWGDIPDRDISPQDYVYVKDVVEICYFLMHHRQHSGIYPVGTGKRYNQHQIKKVFNFILNNNDQVSCDLSAQEMFPEDLSALRPAGYDKPLVSLQEGIYDYIVNYLQEKRFY